MAIPVQKTYDIYATLPAQIAVRIGQAIVENEFTPGQKLREVFDSLEDPVWDDAHTDTPLKQDGGRHKALKKISRPEEKLI